MISRQEFYALVWSQPMTKVAEQFDVTGTYLALVCPVMRVPRPQRGYWSEPTSRDLGIPERLSALGVGTDRIDELAAMAIVDPTAGGNPVELTLDAARALFREVI